MPVMDYCMLEGFGLGWCEQEGLAVENGLEFEGY